MLPYQLHQKLRQQSQKVTSSSSSFDYKKLQKAFWIWDKKQHLLSVDFLKVNVAGITVSDYLLKIIKNIPSLIMNIFYSIDCL